MVTGFESFKRWFSEYSEQYAIIGGTACDLLMSEEGMRKTPNRMIYIGNPIEFDEENFIEELEQLRVTENSDFAEIRAKLREVVPTYTG